MVRCIVATLLSFRSIIINPKLVITIHREQCAPSPNEQRLLRVLVESSELSHSLGTKEEDRSLISVSTEISEAIRRVSKSKTKKRNTSKSTTLIHVKGKSFRVVRSMLYTIRMIASYIQACYTCPSLSPHALRRVLELLQLFNSRTTQLVLGAGALSTTRGRVKQITAKHLALVTQCLSLVINLVPCLRVCSCCCCSLSLSLSLSHPSHLYCESTHSKCVLT